MKIKDTKLNFLYCFDENYNYQAYSSIISLLDCIDENINIHILHNDVSKINFPEIILNHINLENISLYEFKDTEYDFPNLSNNHISVATYFRMFIDNYLPENLESIIYIDSDMICARNPKIKFRKELSNLIKSEYTLAAKTEINLNSYSAKELIRLKNKSYFKNFWPFDRLPVNEKYFNAGFLIINLEKWRERNVQKKLIETMEVEYENIFMWDQDILNCVINGKYLELKGELNFNASKFNKLSELPYIFHYSGSNKPWKTNGAFELSSKFYHQNYEKISNIKYHIETNNKKNSLKNLLIGMYKLSFFKISNPLRYLIIFYKTFTSR